MLHASISADMKDLALLWYALDENNISTHNSNGIYVLRNLNEAEKDIYWKNVYPKLLEILNGLPFDVDNPDLLINRSVTEYEVKTALRNASDQDRVFWLYRKFSGGVTPSDEEYDDTLRSHDTKKHYYNLMEWMQDKIPRSRVRVYDQCSYASYQNNDPQWTQQFDQWHRDVREVLMSSLQNIICQRSSWDEDGCGLGLLDKILTIVQLSFIELFSDVRSSRI